MNYIIRELYESEYCLIEDFLYEAIFLPKGIPAPPKSIIKSPELQVYLRDFGNKVGDFALAAEVDRKVIGLVWSRIMNDYGHIDDATPSLAISLYKEYRGFGIGTALIVEMLSLLKQHDYKQTSLSVQKANYAVRIYKNVGFQIIGENSKEYIMLCNL